MKNSPADDAWPLTRKFSTIVTAGGAAGTGDEAAELVRDPSSAKFDVQQCWELLQASVQDEVQNGNHASETASDNSLSPLMAPEQIADQNETPVQSTPVQRFSPQKTMGVGASGVVLHVFDHILQRHVALKFLRPSLGRAPRLIQRFLREARAVASLDHPGIVRVFESGVLAGQPFMVVELVSGPNLSRLTRETRLSVRQVVWLVQQVAMSVQFAHARGVLHRDLKPSNILLSETLPEQSEGLGLTPRLTDFGLAKRLGNEQNDAESLTIESQIVGTVRYMSPEQASGRLADVAIASDVFSLGVILYELLTGQVPFDAPSDIGVLQRICNEQPTRPCKLVGDLPRDLEAIVLKALEKNPDDRYTSAGAMADDLARYLRGAPIEAAKFSYARQVKYWVRTHPVKAVMGAAVVAGLFIASTLVVTLWLRERSALQRELAANEREQSLRLQADNQKKLALNALNSIFFHLIEKINDGKPISNQEQVELLQQGVEFHQQYTVLYPNDRTSLHRLSIAYHHLANGLVRLQRWDDAIAARQQSMGLIELLLRDEPDNATLQFQLGIAHLHLAHPLQASGQNENAASHLKTSVEIFAALQEAQPANVDFVDAANNARIRYALFDDRNLPMVESVLRQTISSSTQLWQDNRERPVLAKHAIHAGVHLADYYAQRGEIEEGLHVLEQACSLFDAAFGPIREEDWVAFIERGLLRVHGRLLLQAEDRWTELLDVAQRGATAELDANYADDAATNHMQEVIFLKLQVVALQKLGRLEEAEVVRSHADAREKEYHLLAAEIALATASHKGLETMMHSAVATRK